MKTKTKTQWIPFSPTFINGTNAGECFYNIVVGLRKFNSTRKNVERHNALEVEREKIISSYVHHKDKDDEYRKFTSAVNILIDLVKQGWKIRIREGQIQLGRPRHEAGNINSRALIQMQHHAERNEQLRKKSVVSFIGSMETKRFYKNNIVSIFSLIRDGRDLSEKLASVAKISNADEQIAKLNECIQPYLQFVKGEERCKFTGLRLMDIWRYFRHTWTNPYKSIPGRNMMILVRDAATPFHAVIGIASLSSATVGMSVRDDHLGWTASAVLERLKKNQSTRFAHWMVNIVDNAIEEIYKTDLLEDNAITLDDVKCPSEKIIQELLLAGQEHREKHYRFMQSGDYIKKEELEQVSYEHWEKQARTNLFRSKRELELANMLKLRMVLGRQFSKKPTKSELCDFLKLKECHDVLAKIIRKAKAERVGTVMAELTVCGAVPPYNEILGGKLVAMLVASPEVGKEYKRRYSNQPSIIASSMAGKPVVRPSELVFINTTSLYGQRPNQYDRIRIPCNLITDGSEDVIRYKYLGQTKGIGTFHFSEQTVKELSILVSQGKQGQRVHSIFGEGVNPRMRKIRDGLNSLGLVSDEILRHGTPRIVYGVNLVCNVTDYILGISKQPKYYLARRDAQQISEKISSWWLERWVLGRVQRNDTLEKIAGHTLVHPIRHGGRVELPRADIEQELLFEDC
jgi:hypothetical protein